MSRAVLTTAISRHIWDSKYRWREGGEQRIEDTWRRIADALAAAEGRQRAQWAQRFLEVLEGFRFLPGGRIQAGAGTGHRVTLFNCFVMGLIEDSMDGIFDALKEGALTLQQGGAAGPVSFMHIWDSMCATLLSTGARRGAMMATLRCDHPDIEDFIDAKQDGRSLRHFNLSVQVSDGFMAAVRDNREWALVFPDPHDELGPGGADEVIMRHWPGHEAAVPCRVMRRLPARRLWERIMRATYDYAEPGVLFIDRINRLNNLQYREYISATNPCGEIPLPPYGACDLGSLNLVCFVTAPFTKRAAFDWAALEGVVRVAVRMLDNVIDLSRFPLPVQAEQARGTRRIGLGITGLADTLIMLGLVYGSEQALDFAAEAMRRICHGAYRASIELAREKGAFPFFERDAYLASPFVSALPTDIVDGIAACGIRNSHLLAIAPTGTISLLANNVSSGLEPVFDFSYRRRVLEVDGSYTEYQLEDYAYRLWRQRHPGAALPPAFVDARSLAPEVHLRMQAAVQPYVDNAISKTINIPEDFDFNAFQGVYQMAFEQGLKGCTTFRPNPVTGAVLSAAGEGFQRASHCCDLEREAD